MRKIDTESSHCSTIFPLRTMRDTLKFWQGLNIFLRRWGRRELRQLSPPELILARMTGLTPPSRRHSKFVISKAASHSGVRRGWQGLSNFLRKWSCRGVRHLVVRKQFRGARRPRARVWGCVRLYYSPAHTIRLTPPSPHRSKSVISKAASHSVVRRGWQGPITFLRRWGYRGVRRRAMRDCSQFRRSALARRVAQ